MNKSDIKAPLRKFRLVYFAIALPVMILCLVLYAFIGPTWYFLMIFAVYAVSLQFIGKALRKKYIESILIRELDGEKYKAVIYGHSLFYRHGMRPIMAAISREITALWSAFATRS